MTEILTPSTSLTVLTVTLKVGTVALVLVDEVHTIGEERGATLEVILTRMKLVSRAPEVRLHAFLCQTVDAPVRKTKLKTFFCVYQSAAMTMLVSQ